MMRIKLPLDKDFSIISGYCNMPMTIRKINERDDWFQAMQMIEGKAYFAYASTKKAAKNDVLAQIKAAALEMQGTLNI